MKPIVTRKQIVLSILVWIAFVIWSLDRDRRAIPKSPIDSTEVAMAVIFGMAFALSAFLSLRPKPQPETEAQRRGRLQGQRIAIMIVLMGLLGVAGVAVWTSIAPGHIR